MEDACTREKHLLGIQQIRRLKRGGGHLLKGGVLLRACGTPDTDKITIQLTSVGLAQAGSNYTIRVVW